MGVTLTATTSRTVIDLTVDSRQLSQAPVLTIASWKRVGPPPGYERGGQVQSPPAKRRRVDNGGLVKRRDLRQCLVAQVFPYLNQAIGELSPESFRTNDIAQEVGNQVTSEIAYGMVLIVDAGPFDTGEINLVSNAAGRDIWAPNCAR